jgi:Flp pilus assembly protein TadG
MWNGFSRDKSHNRGVSIITTTLALFVLVPIVGLAVDLSVLYLVKVKLQGAVDAAMLAGARALSQGADPGAQAQNARDAAVKFFNANFAAGFWGATNISFPTPAVDETSVLNYRTVSGTASAQVPLLFMRVLGGSHSTVAVGAQAARRDALVELVLDRSISMGTWTVPGTGQTACAIMKQDAKEFVKYFAPGRDQLGLVVFNAGVFSYQSRTNFNTLDASGKSINTLIDQIACNSNTNSAMALNAAYSEILRVNNANRANVIVFMTDGIANGITGDFTGVRISPCRFSGPGVLAQWANFAATGDTAGLMTPGSADVSSDSPAISATNCHFPSDLTGISSDVSRMPASGKDAYGNALAGPYSTYYNPYVQWMGGAVANLTRVDLPREIGKASANAMDNQATAIRSNSTLKPMIYTIGLITNPTSGDTPDPQLLKKIANDPSLARDPAPGPTFYQNQKNQTKGIYVNAPDATQLQSAFDAVATHIVLRLSL